MHVWVQVYPGGRASSHRVRDAADLWELLDWFGHRWGTRKKHRPAIRVAVTSTTGEQLLSFIRAGDCTRHRWSKLHVDHNVCSACGQVRQVGPSERAARARRDRKRRTFVQAAVGRALQGFARNLAGGDDA